jgi:hypothetical protein
MKGSTGGAPRILSLQNILQALFLFVVFEIFEQFISTLRDGGGQRGSGLSSVSILASSKVNSQAESKIRGGGGGGGGIIESKTVAFNVADDNGWRCPFKRKPISCGALDRARWEASENKVVMCLWDSNSQMHKEQLSQFNKPREFKWTRNCVPGYVTQLFALSSSTHYEVASDCCNNDTYKVFLTTEPPSIQPKLYKLANKVKDEFDAVLSLGGPDIIEGPNVIYWPWGSSWVPLENWQIHPKSKLCSIIVSTNTLTIGHKMRHEIVKMLKEMNFECDILGHGYKPLGHKEEGLVDYMFSIVIENSITGIYMTEKIFDAIACGTVPVYWGGQQANKEFGDGILPFQDIEQLKLILPKLNKELYNKMLPALKKNIEVGKKYVPPETWLWKNVFECAYEWYDKHPNEKCELDLKIPWDTIVPKDTSW